MKIVKIKNRHNEEREIKFIKGCILAVVVLFPPVKGKGYTLHKSDDSAVKMSHSLLVQGYRHIIIDDNGFEYNLVLRPNI